MLLSHLTRTTALIGALGLLVAGCVAPKSQVTPDEEAAAPTSTAAPEGGLEGFYGQDIDWEGCGEFECAVVLAPLDWDDPAAGAIELAIKRQVATGDEADRIGSLLINPGGPGSSGYDAVERMVPNFGEELTAAFDVVGFDPRGVGLSSAVDCGDGPTLDDVLTEDVPIENQDDVEAARAQIQAFGEGCLERTGPLLGEIDTVSSARDMDLLRAVLGDDKLYYAGFSYGTFLGATSAELSPENTGRLLLDGALDPSMSNDDLVIGQAEGFEESLRAFVTWCLDSGSCPLRGSVDDGMKQIDDMVARIEAQPIDAGEGKVLNGTMAFTGIIVTLYDDTSWRYLSMALQEVLTAGTGSIFLELANLYLNRTSDGQYTSNLMVAFTAINCLDYPTVERDYDEMVTFAEEVEEVAPTFGRDFAMGVGCEGWPFPAEGERGPIAAVGAPPILVVGTTGDPATPYEWSVALAEQLESGHLLTWEGEGHTAYGRANECVIDTVDAYLVRGEVPAEGARC